jgi:hypothetical protein
MRHNIDLVLTLGGLEEAIAMASELHFSDRGRALGHLKTAERLIREHLEDRDTVFRGLVSVWEKSRLPKGLSLPGKPYVFARDRARHFANRTPDMTYLILDEQLLDLEGYLEGLRALIAHYEKALEGWKGNR